MTEEKHITIKRSSALLAGLILGGLGLLLIGLVAGQTIGERRAAHAGRWQQNYERNFFGYAKEGQHFGKPRHFLKGHALLGEVLTVSENTITVKGQDDTEQSVSLTDNTVIRRNGSAGTRDDLAAGTRVAVFGHPNNEGQVEARLIRMFPSE